MFSRFIDNENAEVVRRNFDRLAWARLVTNATYRFTPPFVAVIARGLHVSVGRLGVAMMIGEFAGLLSPLVGRRIDRSNRVVAMAFGMSGLFLATVLAAVSVNLVMFGTAMFLLSSTKVVFDTGLIVWINDHVPYERRGRVIGVIETSWALGLFIGVSAMGIVTTLVNWRAGFLLGTAAIVFTGTQLLRGLPRHEAHPPAAVHGRTRIPAAGWLILVSFFLLMGAAQTVGIVFGPWFEDDFGFSSGAIVAVVISMGIVELVGSVGSSRVVDDWGKEISVRRGTAVMFVAAVAMAAAHAVPAVAVPMVVLFFLGFEFGLVCVLPVAANMVPGASGAGLGAAVGAGTLGRALMSSVATNLYESHGPVVPSVVAAAFALVAGGLITAYGRSVSGSRS